MCLLQLPESCHEACTTSVNSALAGLFKHPLTNINWRLAHCTVGSKGAELTAYVNGDMKLDLAKFQPSVSAPQPDLSVSGNVHPASSASAKLQIDSTPPGADIEVDGSFMGSTPSEVQVAEGEH